MSDIPPPRPDASDAAADTPPDPRAPHEVTRWRKARRAALLQARMAIRVDERRRLGGVFCDHLRRIIDERFDGARGLVFACYWPIKGEFDVRPLMKELDALGVLIALPVVEVRFSPMVFRRWQPHAKMVRGDWNIPVPTQDAEAVIPDIALAPFMGWTDARYRLGYGGGYYDRTLASLGDRRPFTIGLGLHAAHQETIYPQPHDIPLDMILTEMGVQAARNHPRGQS